MVVHAEERRSELADYLVINATNRAWDVQGPRDHAYDPHTLVEGALVSSFAIGRAHAYIVRGEYILERQRLEAAVAEAYEARLIGKDKIHGWPFDL